MIKTILLLCSAGTVGLAAAEPLSLDRAISLALEHSPKLQAAGLEVRSAERAMDAAGRWTNPQLEFEAENIGGDRDLYDEGQYTLALAKSFQRGGKQSAEKSAARQTLTASSERVTEEKLALLEEVRKAFFEVLAQQEIGTVRSEQEKLGRAFVDVAERRFQTGGGSRLEVVQAELELEEILLQQTCCFGDLAAAQEQLASLIGLPVEQLDTVAAPYFALPPLDPLQLDEAYPALRRLDAQIERLHFTAQRAAAEDASDITLAAGIRHEAAGASQSFVFGASMPLSLNRQGARKQAAMQLMAEAMSAQKAEVRRRLASELAQAAARYEGARKEADLITDRLIPKAEQAYTLSLEGYEAGRFSWIELIAAQQHLMDIRIRQIEALLNAHLIRAEWMKFTLEGIES